MTATTSVKLTFIRHGESTDNLRLVWAGWRDSELSNHGKTQAEALGRSFASTSLTAIHSSPFKRALITAEALQSAQGASTPLHISHLLREQHFGEGEGKRYDVRREPGLSLAQHIAKGKFPVTYGRSERFPGGECLDDVARRADQFVEDVVLPYLRRAANEGADADFAGIHVGVVSHGIFIGELVASLVRRAGGKAEPKIFRGLANTGWTLVEVKLKREEEEDSDDIIPMDVRVVQHNSCEHLDGLVRQKGGIGSAAYDPAQKDIRSFFGGAGQKANQSTGISDPPAITATP